LGLGLNYLFDPSMGDFPKLM